VEQLSQLAESGRGFYKLVCQRADKVLRCGAGESGNKALRVSLSEFSIQHPAVKVELVRRGLTEIGCGERDLTSEQYERILKLSESNVGGKKIELAGGFIVRREYEELVFEHSKNVRAEDGIIAEGVEVEIDGQLRFGGHLIKAEIFNGDSSKLEKFKTEKTNFLEWFDAEKLTLPLKVSRRREGDRFVPLGMADEKKVGRFLTDERVLQRVRKKVLIVRDREKIIWVWPIRISEEVKVTKQTHKILRLEITQ
jgi:tRNA(Ile)-lysidine synthase